MALDRPLKKMMVDALLKVWEEMADAMDPDKPEHTIKRYSKEIQARLIAGEGSGVIIAELMTVKVQELEGAYPTRMEELRNATNDVRMIMKRSKEDIINQKADWREATKRRAEELG